MTSKYYYCPACKERNALKSMAADRVELEKDRGERFTVECAHCHARKQIHVNDVKAEPNKVILGVSGLAGVAGAVALWQVGFIAAITIGFPILVYQAQAKAASSFNNYKVKETK